MTRLCSSGVCPCVLWFLDGQFDGVHYNPPNALWPDPDVMKTLPFDYIVHDPKYDDISLVYCPGYRPASDGRHRLTDIDDDAQWTIYIYIYIFNYIFHDVVPKYSVFLFVCFLPLQANPAHQEEVCLRRRTTRIKLSKYAAFNTYHHCEQCHLYLGFNPRYQVNNIQAHNHKLAVFFIVIFLKAVNVKTFCCES